MPRSLSIFRRRTNLVDLHLPARDGTLSYNFKTASNFDGSFASFQVVPAIGFRSVTAPDIGEVGSQFRGKTRFLFNPADYSLSDTAYLWVRFAPTTTAGVQADEAIHLILPSNAGYRNIILRGSAPMGAAVANSLEINLPQTCQSISFKNESGNALFVAFQPDGPEVQIAANTSSDLPMYPTFSQIFVRGAGGTATFQMVAAVRNERL